MEGAAKKFGIDCLKQLDTEPVVYIISLFILL